jgi:PAS domain S-box-containing protein
MLTMATGGHSSGRPGQAVDLRLLIDSTPGLIHTALPDGYLDFFNQTWLRYVGRSSEDLQGWKWTASIHPDDVEGMVEKWRASLASGEPFLHEARVLRADGKYRWMLHHKIALRDSRGTILKWYGSSLDIEDRRRAEDELRRSEFYLAEGQRLGHIGSWAFNPAGFFDFWSRELFQIYELDPEKGPPSLERLGSTKTKKVNVRVIAATHRDLEGMIIRGQFRPDICYRLNVFPIRIPPLRKRPDDIPLLVWHFINYAASRMNKTIDSVPEETMDALTCYPWPENIRELENVIERAVIVSRGPRLEVSLRDLRSRMAPGDDADCWQTLEEVERKHILATLKRTRWVLSGPSGAARRLGLNRSTLRFRMKKLGIVRSFSAISACREDEGPSNYSFGSE